MPWLMAHGERQRTAGRNLQNRSAPASGAVPVSSCPPRWWLPQTVKHRDERGRLLSSEIRAALGAPVEPPGTVHSERLNGTLRDRLTALTRKTHAFAKTDVTWEVLLGVQIFAHHWLRPHPALGTPSGTTGRRSDRRTPAMALHLTDHVWSWHEFLTTPVYVSS